MSNGERAEEEVRRNARTIRDFFHREGIGIENSDGRIIEDEEVIGLLERAVRKVMQENYPRKVKPDQRMDNLEDRLMTVEKIVAKLATRSDFNGRR